LKKYLSKFLPLNIAGPALSTISLSAPFFFLRAAGGSECRETPSYRIFWSLIFANQCCQFVTRKGIKSLLSSMQKKQIFSPTCADTKSWQDIVLQKSGKIICMDGLATPLQSRKPRPRLPNDILCGYICCGGIKI
jgi:hypothetical protein